MSTGKLDAIREFYNFLVKHNALEAYLHNVKSDLGDTNTYRFSNIIENSFGWALASEGIDYWIDLDNGWHEYYTASGKPEIKLTLLELYNILTSFPIPTSLSYEYW